ncbi:hypothetical protein [Amycolatopsis magusensis]|uniref:Peptidase inhibitor family I36 n=1 Tax=Amycolatopsis magusensis TaxID=882444 RepID=A0ABS4PPL9_9PSEU|nr:hypothetical protein [Amycolatopsis magusensis]MBP2181383.1 hypothetical protein [Amycolatopsis magusensis]MDI5980328.1 hypothetical protein [Amycolatopsis magusensis]
MKKTYAVALSAAAALAPIVLGAPAASASTTPSAQIAELCVHTGYNYSGSKTCSNGWARVGIGNYHIHSWSNTTNRRWCLESNNGTWYAHPGYEPAVDYGNAVFTSAYEC